MYYLLKWFHCAVYKHLNYETDTMTICCWGNFLLHQREIKNLVQADA